MVKEVRNMQIEEIIRRLSIKQLQALSTFIPSGERTGEYLSVEKASNTVYTAEDVNKDKVVGGIISSLAKIVTVNGALILPAGKSEEEGMRWVLNKKVISKEELKNILLEIPGLEIY